MTDNIKLVLGIALAALLFGSGWLCHSWYTDSLVLAMERVKDEVSVVNAEAIAKIKVENTTTYAKTIEKVTKETVYRDCKADDAMMILTNKTLGF